jgi:hypothetical protein
MASWPVAAPQYFLVGTLEITSEPNVAEFKPDVGSPLRRQRYTDKRYFYSGSMQAQTVAEREALDDFFTVDCADGALPFSRNDWLDEATPATFEWVSPPTFQHVALDIWRVGIQVAKIPSGGNT